MGLHLHLHSLQAPLFLAIMLAFVSKSISSDFPIAKQNCVYRCGNLRIPFPFGLTKGCSYNSSFLVTCNDTHYDPPVAFWGTINVTDISLKGQMYVLKRIAKSCYSQNGTRVLDYDYEISTTLDKGLTVNNTANKFIAVGCDTYGFVSGYQVARHFYETGCTSWCTSKDDLVDGSCSGIGCCKTSIPKLVQNFDLTAKSYHNFTYSYDNNQTTVWNFNNCSYGLLVEDTKFNFSAGLLSSLRDIEKLPMVVDWAVGEGTCEDAKRNMPSYACKSANSTCYEPDNGSGYRCNCEEGYEGNPYLIDGCRDIDECQDPKLNKCESENNCVNTKGGFNCTSPKGYHGDGMKNGHDRDQSSLILKLVTGVALGIIVLFLLVCGL